jgi:hypothetical protein
MIEGEKFTLTLVALGGPQWQNNPSRRLAALLKAALRHHGFRCISYALVTPEASGRDDSANTDAAGNAKCNATSVTSALRSGRRKKHREKKS